MGTAQPFIHKGFLDYPSILYKKPVKLKENSGKSGTIFCIHLA
jgi:hypothetical protein